MRVAGAHVRMSRKLNVFLIGMLTLMWTASAIAGELRVSVGGVKNSSENLRVALYRTPDGFATKAGRFMEVVLPARRGANEAVFSNVPVGSYGLAAFHDENDNVEFDKNFFGFPQEGFGFGNDASVFLGPPNFSEATVTVNDGIKHVSLTLLYW